MDGSDRELRDVIQAQKVEIDELRKDLDNVRLDTDKSRTAMRERPIMSKKPRKVEGKDSDHRFFIENKVKYYATKVEGKWVKMEVSDV